MRLLVSLVPLVPLLLSAAPAPFQPVVGLDAEAQELTFERMRILGEAMLRWATDNTSSWVPARIDVGDYQLMSHRRLTARLVPMYIDRVPSDDGWGNRFELYLPSDPAGLLVQQILLIRSPGRDRWFDADVYEPGSFGDRQYDRDLVWADGYFVRWPRHLCEPQQPYNEVCRVQPDPSSGASLRSVPDHSFQPPRPLRRASLTVGVRAVEVAIR